MTAHNPILIGFHDQRVDQLAVMLKAIGQPLRIQLIAIISQKRLVSIPTLLDYLPGIDPFVLYSNLRYMQKKHVLKKRRKGRDIYYGLSDEATSAGFVSLFLGISDLREIPTENN